MKTDTEELQDKNSTLSVRKV